MALVHFMGEDRRSLCGAVNPPGWRKRAKLLSRTPFENWIICPGCLEEKVFAFNATLREGAVLYLAGMRQTAFITPDLRRKIQMGIVRL